MKTIKELADELGVSKTAIRKYMTQEFREAHTQTTTGNIIEIDEDGCKLLAETIKKPQETGGNQFPKTSANTGLQEEIAFLRSQLEAKDHQLEAKDRQLESKDAQIASLTAALENTTASLQAAQALHAGTMKEMLPEGAQESATTIEIDSERENAGGFWSFFGRRRKQK